MIRVVLPYHLRTLARVGEELQLDLGSAATIDAILEEIETRYPMLRGAVRDHHTKQRRPFIRYFACQEDLSHQPAEAPLPKPVLDGAEPFMIIGAMAGG